MKHYFCPGDCGGEADRPGVCLATGCTHEEQPLVPCSCEDGSHAENLEEKVPEDEGQMEESNM